MDNETKFLDLAGLQYYTAQIKALLDEKLTFDYAELAFDTSEIVVDVSSGTSAILGKAVLGKLTLM